MLMLVQVSPCGIVGVDDVKEIPAMRVREKSIGHISVRTFACGFVLFAININDKHSEIIKARLFDSESSLAMDDSMTEMTGLYN